MSTKQDYAAYERRPRVSAEKTGGAGPRDFTDKEWGTLCAFLAAFGLLVLWLPV